MKTRYVLAQITYPNSSTNTFGYNGFGARVSKTDSSGTSTYFRAGTSVVSPVLSDGSATYTRGISERRNNNSTFYHSDLKNTTTQTASNETISGTNTYDAFGNLIDYSGTWNSPFAYGGAFGYQTDNDSGLMLLGHRYYDSSTGRFLSRDSAKDGSNWYRYCENNPVNFFDNKGLSSEPVSLPPPDKLIEEGFEEIPHDPRGIHRRLKHPDGSYGYEYNPARPGVKKGDGAKPHYHLIEPHPTKAGKWIRKAGAKAIPIIGLLLLAVVAIADGPEATVKEAVYYEEIQAATNVVREWVDGLLDSGTDKVRDYYNNQAGFTKKEQEEWGFGF